jgi:hypothetical protein
MLDPVTASLGTANLAKTSRHCRKGCMKAQMIVQNRCSVVHHTSLSAPHLTALACLHLLLAKELDGAASRGRLPPSGPDLVMLHES